MMEEVLALAIAVSLVEMTALLMLIGVVASAWEDAARDRKDYTRKLEWEAKYGA